MGGRLSSRGLGGGGGGGGKRPPWLSVLMLLGSALLWVARKKGWFGTGPRARQGAGPTRTGPGAGEEGTAAERASRPAVAAADIGQLLADNRSHVWVEGAARVVKLLPDDDEQPRHQRFLAETSGGCTILIAHNVDVSDRVPVRVDQEVRFRGEFVCTEHGGRVHFTHRPQYGDFAGGWIAVGGRKYE